MVRASDEERFYQCLTCLHIESCNLDEESEDERGMCRQYSVDKNIEKSLQNTEQFKEHFLMLED
jgi:hypothetical protein